MIGFFYRFKKYQKGGRKMRDKRSPTHESDRRDPTRVNDRRSESKGLITEFKIIGLVLVVFRD